MDRNITTLNDKDESDNTEILAERLCHGFQIEIWLNDKFENPLNFLALEWEYYESDDSFTETTHPTVVEFEVGPAADQESCKNRA